MKHILLLSTFFILHAAFAQISKEWDKSYNAQDLQFYEFTVDDKDKLHTVRSGSHLLYEIFNKSGDILYTYNAYDSSAILLHAGKPAINDKFKCVIPVVKQLSGGGINYLYFA